MTPPSRDAELTARGKHSDSELASALVNIASSAVFLTEVQGHAFSNNGSRNGAASRPYEHDPEKGFTMDIMMMMDMTKVSALRREFQQKDRGLSIAEFVHVMMRFVQSTERGGEESSRLRNLSERQLIANLCELFAQIDINGDGSMEWEEFTSFIVETGLTVKSHQPNSIQHYHHVPWEDASKHSTFIDHIYYFPFNDQIALIENCSPALKLYNTECEFVRSIKSPEGFVQCAEHIPKLDQYVLASSDLQLRFYDDTNLRLVKSCHTPTSQNCLKWYPVTTTLFSAGVSGVVYAWDAERMEERHHMGGDVRGKVLTRSHDDIVLDLLTLPTLESLASASMDRTIRLWDVHTGKHKQQLDGHQKGVRALAYSPEYRFLVSAGFDFDALVWNPYVDQLILRLHGHSNSLCGVEIIPDTPQIITADVDGIFKVWDIRNFACMQTFTAESMGDVKKIVSATSQKRIVAAGKKLTKFDYEKLENPELTDDHPVFSALYNPTSLSFITAAGRDVKIWDARLGKLLRVYRSLSQTDLTSLTLDCRERKLIVGDHSGLVQVFDYLNGSHMKSFAYPEVNNLAHSSEVSRLWYCAEHMTVISVSWDGAIDIHDESTSERGVLLRRLVGGHGAEISALSFSFQLSLIASGSSDATLQIWDFEFGRLDTTCIGHVSGVLAVEFLEPYPLLLSTDNGGNVCLWGMRPSRYKGKCVYRFRNQRGSGVGGGLASVNCVAVHVQPNAYLVVAGDDKGVISIWDLRPILTKLDEDYNLKPLDRAFECANPRRNLRVNAEGMVRKVRNGPEYAAYRARDPSAPFYFASGMPLVSGESVAPTCRHQWHAHSDIVYSVQMIREPLSLVTSSFDRRVKVWSLAGECLGILMQGDMGLSKRPWKFRVDYAARERKKEEAAEPVIEDVHRLADDADREATAEAASRRRRRERARRARERESECTGSGGSVTREETQSEGDHVDDVSEGGLTSASVSVLEDIVHAPLQLPPLRGSKQLLAAAAAVQAGVRKTPRRVPVSVTTAGRMQILSPRQLRMLSRAGSIGQATSSPRGGAHADS